MFFFTPIQSIHLGFLNLSIHGFLIALGFLIAEIFARNAAKKRGIDPEQVDNAAIIAVMAGLIGARVAYVLTLGRSMDFLQMFSVWEGGLSSHGGYIFGITFGLLYVWYKKINVAVFADVVLPYVLIGWAIGRLGCFLNWDSYGSIGTGLFTVNVYGESRYATQLMESLGYLLAFFIHKIIITKKIFSKFKKGSTAVLAILLFAFVRFLVDFFRGDIFSYLLFSRVITLSIIILAVSYLFWSFNKHKNVVK